MNNLYLQRCADRFQADLNVLVKLNVWNPLSKKKAKLLDFSMNGFRLEFAENLSLNHVRKIKLIIPLNSLYEGKIKYLELKGEIKWYDPLHKQVGGIFTISLKFEENLVQKIISLLEQNKKIEA